MRRTVDTGPCRAMRAWGTNATEPVVRTPTPTIVDKTALAAFGRAIPNTFITVFSQPPAPTASQVFTGAQSPGGLDSLSKDDVDGEDAFAAFDLLARGADGGVVVVFGAEA